MKLHTEARSGFRVVGRVRVHGAYLTGRTRAYRWRLAATITARRWRRAGITCAVLRYHARRADA